VHELTLLTHRSQGQAIRLHASWQQWRTSREGDRGNGQHDFV